MTSAALTQGNSLIEQIQQLQAAKTSDLAKAKSSFPTYTNDQIATINTAISAIYDTEIATLQTEFANLSGDYTG